MAFIKVEKDLFIYQKELGWFCILLYSDICNYYYHEPRLFYTKSQSTIAEFFNVPILTVKRAMAKLKKYNLIRTKRHKKTLLIFPNPTKDSLLYKEKFKGVISNENQQNTDKIETNRIIKELREKWTK